MATGLAFQEIWAAYREPRFARSRIVCTNVAESGITMPKVGLVISSGAEDPSKNKQTHPDLHRKPGFRGACRRQTECTLSLEAHVSPVFAMHDL